MKKFLECSDPCFRKKDFVVLGIIILFYTILSFYRLGSFINPNTFYDAQKGDELTVELNSRDDIIKMKLFNGDKNASYKIFVADDGIHFHYLKEVEGEGAFAWDEVKLLSQGKYVKFVFLEDSSLGELAFYNNKKEKINIKKISSNKKNITVLTDEKKTIPKQISYYNSSYFDEIYFARTAYEYTMGMDTYEWTHPPLGKLLQAIPIYLTNTMAPFYYRFMGNVSGILMIAVMYFFALKLFKKRKYAVFASLLMCFDTFHFAQTRMGTVDSHLVLFILLALYFMYLFTDTDKIRYLCLSGVFFGLSVSVKWTGFYGGLALAIVYFLYLFWKKKFHIKYFGYGFLFFVLIPITFYGSLYLLFPNNRIYTTNHISNIVNQQIEMYEYHSNLESTHYFSSAWYTWPVVYKPVWYHNQVLDVNTRETISSVGNVVIWWMGIISFLYLIFKIIVKRDKKALFLVITILSLWLPYAFIGRVMFLYHYFPVLPFLMLSIVLFFKDMNERFKLKLLIPTYLVLVILFFIIYYPVVSGIGINNNYIDSLKLFNSWYF